MKRRNNFSVFHTRICSQKYVVRGSFERCKGTNFNDSGMSSYLMLNIFYCNTTKKREQKPNSCFRKKKKTALHNIFSKFSIPSTVPLIASEIKLHMMKEHLSVSPSGFPQECGWNNSVALILWSMSVFPANQEDSAEETSEIAHHCASRNNDN